MPPSFCCPLFFDIFCMLFRRKTNMNFVSPHHALSRAAFCTVIATALLSQSAAFAQQPAPQPIPQPAPAGTVMPPMPTGNIPGPQPANGAPAIMPLPKGAQGNAPPFPTPGATTNLPTPSMPVPVAPKILGKSDPLPAKVTELTMRDDAPGDGAPVLPGQAVTVQYTGWLYDAAKPEGKGSQFDSSRTRQLPFGFIIGAGRVIKGWDQGVVGMKTKGKRTLIIPPQLGYGANAKGDKIPANSTLIFEVELVEVLTPPNAAAGGPPVIVPGKAVPFPAPPARPAIPSAPSVPSKGN
jgi:FKBP-type peptidyl-prolyl cis-trans isomerase FkpA